MMFKRIVLSLSLMVGMGLPAVADNSVDGAKKQLIVDQKYLGKINETFGPGRSVAREVAERIILSLLHKGVSIKDGKPSVDPKKALTETRDMLYKGAAYKLLDKAVMEAVQKVVTIEEKQYKTYGSPLVSDGLDIIFRGIKYFNDDTKEQTMAAYVKSDLAPYLVKKKIVWLTNLAIRKALEQSEYGRKFLAVYEIAQLIPFIGIELEDAPKTILEFLYDKSLEKGKYIVQKYVVPKIKSLQTQAA